MPDLRFAGDTAIEATEFDGLSVWFQRTAAVAMRKLPGEVPGARRAGAVLDVRALQFVRQFRTAKSGSGESARSDRNHRESSRNGGAALRAVPE